MNRPEINPKIIESLGLSENETKVFDVLISHSMGRNATDISRRAGLPRTTAIYILKRFESRKIADKVQFGKKTHWKYHRGLEFLERRLVQK